VKKWKGPKLLYTCTVHCVHYCGTCVEDMNSSCGTCVHDLWGQLMRLGIGTVGAHLHIIGNLLPT